MTEKMSQDDKLNALVELIKGVGIDKLKLAINMVEQTEHIEQNDEENNPPTRPVRQTTKEDDIVSLNKGRPPTSKRKPIAPSSSVSKNVEPPKQTKRNVQARIVPFDPTEKRPDLFVELGLDQGCKEDVEIDKKLNEGRKPTQRGTRQTMVKVRCCRCDKEYTVSNKLVFRDKEEGLKYTCDRCIGR